MPSVMTISGAELDGPRGRGGMKCKRVKRKGKHGCSTLLCHTGKGATGWTFMKDSTRCPRRPRTAKGR
jgi:hypothetical protein